MRDDPLVSVIIPTYNRAHIIRRTIDNVLAQSYSPTEIIIVDDGSTDETQLRLRPYGGRIRIITQSNAGPSAARNRGIEASRGEFIALQDSDDLWMPSKLDRQVRLLQRVGRSVACCLCDAILRYIDRSETTAFRLAWLFPTQAEGIWTNVAQVLATRFVWFCQTSMVRREALERIGGFDETLKYHEDYDLPFRLALEGPWAFIRDPLTIWHQGNSDSWSQKARSEEIQMRQCEIRMRQKILARLEEGGNRDRLRGLLTSHLKRNRRELWRAHLACKGTAGVSLVAGFVGRLERYYWAVHRRSPWYPKFESQSISEFEFLLRKASGGSGLGF